MSINVKLIGDRVLIKPDNSESVSKSGIHISSDAIGTATVKKGYVISVGSGTVLEDGGIKPMTVASGNKVMYRYGEQILIDGEEYDIVNESDVLLVVE